MAQYYKGPSAPPTMFATESNNLPMLWRLVQAILLYLRETYEVLRGVMAGKLNCVSSVTLTINVGSSTMADSRITPESVISFMPTTANAAAEIGNGTMYVSARTKQSATITHANNAQADRTFAYSVLG